MATFRQLLEQSDSFTTSPLEPGTDEQIAQAEQGNALARQNLSLRTGAEMAQRDREAEGRWNYEESLKRGLQTGNPSAIQEMQRRKQAKQEQQLNFKMLIDLAKGDPDTASALLERITGISRGPSILDRKRQEKIDAEERAQRNREETFVFQNLGSYVNKQTGQKAIELPEAPNLDEIKKNYVKLSPTQLTNIDALRGLDNQIDQYEGVLTAMNYPEPGLGVVTGGIDVKRRRLLGDAKVRRLDAVRAEITQLARAFGGDSRVSDKEMEKLENAVLKDFESDEGAKEAINVLKEFRDSRARAIGIPGLVKQRREKGASKDFTKETAIAYLKRFGGDRAKAEAAARADGYQF